MPGRDMGHGACSNVPKAFHTGGASEIKQARKADKEKACLGTLLGPPQWTSTPHIVLNKNLSVGEAKGPGRANSMCYTSPQPFRDRLWTYPSHDVCWALRMAWAVLW